MFGMPAPYGNDPAARNRNRTDTVRQQVGNVIAELRAQLADVERLREILDDPEWTKNADQPGYGYHRAEYIGRTFAEINHNRRRVDDHVVLLLTVAGGFEDEAASDG